MRKNYRKPELQEVSLKLSNPIAECQITGYTWTQKRDELGNLLPQDQQTEIPIYTGVSAS